MLHKGIREYERAEVLKEMLSEDNGPSPGFGKTKKPTINDFEEMFESSKKMPLYSSLTTQTVGRAASIADVELLGK